jgi:hypothetical protein
MKTGIIGPMNPTSMTIAKFAPPDEEHQPSEIDSAVHVAVQ